MTSARLLPLTCLLLILTASAQELPSASAYRGEIKRNAQGELVAVPGGAPLPAEQTGQTAPAAVSPILRRDRDPAPAPRSSEVEISAGKAPFACAPQALTCIEVRSSSDKTQASVPLTFGQPFRLAHLRRGDHLQARDGKDNPLPLQVDAESSHPDGSLRFAVLSTRLQHLQPGETRIVNLFRGTAATSSPAASAAKAELKIRATLYSPQVSLISFGNRSGNAPGTPFEAGEDITLQLGEAPDERFTLTVTPEQAGGHFPNLTKIAEAFLQLVNSRSRTFRAYKTIDGCAFETLCITSRAPDAGAFAIRFIYTGKAKHGIQVLQDYRPPRQLEAQVRDTGSSRLSGPVVNETPYVAPFKTIDDGRKHPQLTARLLVRSYAGDNRQRLDLALENNWAYAPDPGNLLYELTVSRGNETIFQQPPFVHYHHARWHKVFWLNGAPPQAELRHDMPYFLASRITWNYDLKLAIPDKVLADEAARLAAADTRPMGGAFITPYFPSTGGRHDIGPLPRWTALYLVTQDARARAAMLANADAAAGIPIHYRDQPSDQPISLEDHPGVAFVSGQSSPADKLPPVRNGASPWVTDVSHQASFAYIPYLITGDLFYLEETAFWASWNMGSINPDYRSREKGLIHPEQVRGQAWGLRSIAEATYALPDRHPLKAYFKRRLANNLAWYSDFYPAQGGNRISPLGLAEKDDLLNNTRPWMNDFLAIVFGWLAENQEAHAKTYLNWLSKFTVGRFTSESRGYCRAKGPAYTLKIFDEQKQPISDWGKLYRLNWPQQPQCAPGQEIEGLPKSAAGYAAYARAMLAVLSGLDIAGAANAYSWLSEATPDITLDSRKDPTWAIVPRTSISR